jgi:glutathione S-transferase
MRARLALAVSGTELDLVEVALSDKPAALISASPKATVPVVVLDDGRVLEESLEIMLWALGAHDPLNWLGEALCPEMLTLIAQSDGEFKYHLDRTKYAVRFEGADPEFHREQAMVFLGQLADRLGRVPALFGAEWLLADWAIFPFVRQFANIDRARFERDASPALVSWLDKGLSDPLFVAVMKKGSRWAGGR